MRLELASFQVDDVVFSPETRLEGKTLHVNVTELKDRLLPNPYIQDVKVEVARPGESVRIVNAIDVVEPRDKISGPGTVFPGRWALRPRWAVARPTGWRGWLWSERPSPSQVRNTGTRGRL